MLKLLLVVTCKCTREIMLSYNDGIAQVKDYAIQCKIMLENAIVCDVM